MTNNALENDLEHVLAHTQALWDEFRGSRIFITGGTGFFGSWLLETWTLANERFGLGGEAVVLTREPAAFQERAPHLAYHASVSLHQGDVRTFDFPPGRFSHVIHAATPSNPKTTAPGPFATLDTILYGTRRTLECAVQTGAKKFLSISSGAVYGQQPAAIAHLTEDHCGAPDPLNVRSEYGEGKRVAELLGALYSHQYGVQVKIARCFAFVGPYLPLDVHFAVGNFIWDGLKGGPVHVAGDGTPYRSYLYAADLVIWLWTILAQGQSCRPYNVGSELALTIGELAQRIADHFGVKRVIQREAISGQSAQRYVPSTQRAETELGLRLWVSLDEAIERTIRWHQTRRALADPSVGEGSPG
ncbi:MAG: NAD-dependent epimerase/dehydratase family protein [Isosphaeraceae bacterium]|nr:NAD-dependent epimerase/dehydratase family protein [Isosphaeraceae bacterium]